MTFFSIPFLLFWIGAFLVNSLLPGKMRPYWLLLVSYAFYASWSVSYLLVLLLVTVLTYAYGRLIPRYKGMAFVGIPLILLILVLFKFWNFWAQALAVLFRISSLEEGGIMTLIAPVGLSFYALEAIGYMADIYRGKVMPEKNFFHFALFLSFFPKILSGPIERSYNLLMQIKIPASFRYEKVRHGFLYAAWGFFLKLLIADPLCRIVDAAFSSYADQTGAALLIALILYSFQLYTDFAGYSALAVGIGETLGFDLLPNFQQPYFAATIRDFWSRWHMSLSAWLKDYVYIPLGGNRRGKFLQYINLLLTFLVSGLWHGIGVTFLVWGALHGLYQIVGRLTYPLRKGISKLLRLRPQSFSYRLSRQFWVFVYVTAAWLFFRAPSLTDALSILRQIFTDFQLLPTLSGHLYLMDTSVSSFIYLLLGLLLVLVIDILHENNVGITSWLGHQNRLFRWLVYMLFGLILIFGLIYNFGMPASTFIYTRF